MDIVRTPFLGAPPVRVDRACWLRAALAAVCALVAFAGCPGRNRPAIPDLKIVASDDPAAEAELRAAQAAEQRGDLAEARQRYKAFVENWPEDPTAPLAMLALGRIALEQSSSGLAEARRWFQQASASKDEAIAERARMYRAVADQRAGDHHGALEVLKPLVGRTVDPAETALVLRTIADAYDALGDVLASLETRDHLLRGQLPPLERERQQEAVKRLIEQLEPEALLPRAYELLPRDGYAWPWVAYRLLRVRFERSENEQVLEIAADLAEQGVALDEDLRALVLRAERSKLVDLGVIGAILPLSGRGREVGQSALRGLMLAAGLPRTTPPDDSTPRLEIRDDEGNPELARKAVEDLVTLHRVVAIIGPIASASARAAAARAAELGVPLIALSPDAQLDQAGDGVFRLYPTPHEEAAALVGHALRQDARRFALMHPSGGFGERMERSFAEAIAAQGGELVTTLRYSPTQTSFGAEVEALLAADFDALILADSSTRIALIAPALSSAGIWSAAPGREHPDERDVLWLLPSAGFHPRLLETSRRYLQGAVFASAFDATRGGGAQFREAFRAQYDSEPTQFSAFAHDAYALIQAALARGAQTRAEVIANLPEDGATLITQLGGLTKEGAPRRAGGLFVISGQTFTPVLP